LGRRPKDLPLLVAHVQHDHRPPRFADDAIVVAAAAALKPRFRRKEVRAETNHRDQNNQANGRKQNRIIKSHAVMLAASHGFVKSWFLQLLQLLQRRIWVPPPSWKPP